MIAKENQSVFEHLAPPLQRCLWEQGWTGLRAAQLEALPLILDGREDVVIAASTASGKPFSYVMRQEAPRFSACLAMLPRLAVAVPLALCCIGTACAAGPVGLLDAVRLTLAKNPDIQLQEKQVEFSQGTVQQAAGQFDPALSLTVGRSVDNSPQYDGGSQSVTPIKTATTAYNLALDTPLRNGIVLSPSVGATSTTGTVYDLAQLPAQNRGKVNFSIRVPLLKGSGESAAAGEIAANLEWAASKEDLRYAIAQSVLNTVTAYWGLLAAGKSLDIARESEASVRRMVGETRKLIEADELPAADLNMLRASLLDKTAARIFAEQALLNAQQRLGQAMGLPYLQISALEAADGFPSLPTGLSALESQLARLIGMAMQRRPDLKAAQLHQDSARTLTGAAQTNLKPQLDVTVSVGYAGLAEGGSAGALGGLTQNRGGANIGTSISYQWPFDNNVARGRYRQQAAVYDQSTIRAASVERAIGIGVESALTGLARGALQLRESEEAVELYRISLENEKTKYLLGTSTMIDVLTVNDRLLNARLSNISYRLNTLNALAQLNFQTGALLAEDELGQSIRLDQLVSVPKPD